MSEFVNRFESENSKPVPPNGRFESEGMKPVPASVKDSMGYIPQPPPDKPSVKDQMGHFPQPPRSKLCTQVLGLGISIHIGKGVMDKYTQLRARNDFR